MNKKTIFSFLLFIGIVLLLNALFHFAYYFVSGQALFANYGLIQITVFLLGAGISFYGLRTLLKTE